MADAGTDELVLHADGAEREARVGVPSPVVVVAVAVQVLRPAGHVRIPLIPRLKMSFSRPHEFSIVDRPVSIRRYAREYRIP